ncbi:MAG: acyl-CoA dehydrogenase family protein [Candidatus Phosphoribacter sp.]
MNLQSRLEPVLHAARSSADSVDSEGVFPEAAVSALRGSGLMGLTLPESVGGLGQGPEQFRDVISQIAGACGSTAMIYLMHVSAAMPLSVHPPQAHPHLLEGMADGTMLGTLAFSERGSRSHFWAPLSKCTQGEDGVHLEVEKSWVTSAGHADVYVISTQSAKAESTNESDLYAVLGIDAGVKVAAPWVALGLRGNASSPVSIDTTVSEGARVGAASSGFTTMMEVVLPWFNLGNASVTTGLARAALQAAVKHVSGARLEHVGSSLADLPTIRHRIGRAGAVLAAQEAYLRETARAITEPDDSTLMHVIGSRASANDAALEIIDEAMRVCGGAAFSKHLPIERYFRDARAGHVMAPTSDVLYDLYARVLCGMELFA